MLPLCGKHGTRARQRNMAALRLAMPPIVKSLPARPGRALPGDRDFSDGGQRLSRQVIDEDGADRYAP